MYQRWCVWHVIARDNFSVWRWRGGSILSPSVKDILIKKVEKMKGGAVDARWYGAQRKFHFLPCTEKIVSAWENLAERWEIYPPNIDNHLFISWQQQGEKKCTSLLWNGVGWVFPSLSRFFFCSAADGSLFRRQHAAVVLITESVIIGEGAFAASAA